MVTDRELKTQMTSYLRNYELRISMTPNFFKILVVRR
jgi:hypothetical protein